MSKRTLRRAAERKARKADRLQNLTATSVAATNPVMDESSMDQIGTSAAAAPALDVRPAEEVANIPQSAAPVEAPSATPAQIAANQANSQLSTGPTSAAGKAIVSQNRRAHGLTGKFDLLVTESLFEFRDFANSVYEEHNPQTDTEQRLVDSVIQHYWLMQRAIKLQAHVLGETLDATEADQRKLSLFLRYQSTHERSYYRAMRELQNSRKHQQKAQIGFESQNRVQEAHEAKVRLTHARAQTLEVDSACRHVMEAPLPGTAPISFPELTEACSAAISKIVFNRMHEAPLVKAA